jgi:hypothetical protein
MATWHADSCLRNVMIVKRPDTGADPDILDGLLGFGTSGNPFLADIVNAGWMPKAFFDTIAPNGGNAILAFSITFIWYDLSTTPPTPPDINGDNYRDAAFTAVYYNDHFGAPGGAFPGNPWGINLPLPSVDVQTVALHENGHSLGLGHFGPPPQAVMSPAYSGIQQALASTDHAGACTTWARWPR